MFKKIAHILIAILIFLGTSGISISKHYCGTSLKDISINLSPDNCCDIPMDCCHNETLSIKIEDDFAISTSTYDFDCQTLNLETSTEILNKDTFAFKSLNVFIKEIPPPKIQTALSLVQSYLL
jgi:hypothetical protein